MTIGLNTSIGISRDLSRSQALIARALERLSSGKRINSPSDDVGGYSTIQKLDSQIRGLTQANLSLNTGSGLLQTADAALSPQIDIVQRMRELAVQASNGLLSSTDRDNINEELFALRDEFQRIATSTSFGDIDLLDGSRSNIKLTTGSGAGETLDMDLESSLSTDAFVAQIGQGSFTSTGTISLSDQVDDLIGADVNNDGNQDLVAQVTGSVDEYQIFLGDGKGGFSLKDQVSFSGVSVDAEVEDVNGDGILDIYSGETILLGNGDGTFTASLALSFTSVQNTKAGDFNGDGVIDFASGGATAASFYYQLGNEDGTYQAEGTITTGNAIDDIAVGDFNGDGFDDIVTADQAGDARVFFGAASNPFSTSVLINASTTTSVEVGDLDGDGKLDIALTEGSAANVYLYYGKGDGSFVDAGTVAVGATINDDIRLEDINSDGVLDIVSGEGRGILSDGARSYSETINLGAGFTGSIATGDFDNDGAIDFYLGESANDRIHKFSAIVESVSAVSRLNANFNAEAAGSTIAVLDNALEYLTDIRSEISAELSRIETITDSNLLQTESLTEAKINIESADFAIETTNLVAAQIQQQAQIASLSQANSQLQVVLGLLP